MDSGSTRLFLLYIQSLSLKSGVDEVYVSFVDLNQDLESEDARSKAHEALLPSSAFSCVLAVCAIVDLSSLPL